MYGEDALGHLRLDKAGPRWQHGIWLGKVASGDMHIVGTSQGIFLTRSIRRNAVPFNPNRFADIEHYPWEFGLAALGSRLIHNKRVSQPVAFGVGAALPPQLDLEAINVAKYALEHPDEDVEHEVGAGHADEKPPDDVAPTTPIMNDTGLASEHGQKRADDEPGEDADKRPKFADAAFRAMESAFLLDDSETGEHAPKTPELSEDEYKKHLQQVTSTDLSLYEHEDQPVKFSFHPDELGELEEYELNFDNGDFYDTDEVFDDDISKQLIFPQQV